MSASVPLSPEIGPAFRSVTPPVIIIGMHRSGTSLAAGMLATCGLYLDPEMPPPESGNTLDTPNDRLRSDGYCEAVAFRLLNESLLERAGSAWDEVERFLRVREDPAFATRRLETLRRATFEELDSAFMSLMRSNAAGWGWKDPRTSVTLPYWLRLFPTAKVLHVRRDPKAVLASLTRRAESTASQPSVGTRLKRAIGNPAVAARAIERRLGLSSADRPLRPSADHSDRYAALIDTYVHECERWRSLGDRYLEVSFEEIVNSPVQMAERMAVFANVRRDSGSVGQAATFVRR